MLPVYVLDFVPGQFGFKSPMTQSYDPETLLGVALQNFCKVFWHCRDKKTLKNISQRSEQQVKKTHQLSEVRKLFQKLFWWRFLNLT